MQQNTEKGRILRVKTGYNPNSSSIGSQIPAFLAYAVGTGALAVFISQLSSAVKAHLGQKKSAPDAEKTK
ncbi:MAG: hypothetical protein LLF76_13795 [Planctomycetaceae bacterium]|nr:hypothetical protein [Planctomycetaceae bacterium]